MMLWPLTVQRRPKLALLSCGGTAHLSGILRAPPDPLHQKFLLPDGIFAAMRVIHDALVALTGDIVGGDHLESGPAAVEQVLISMARGCGQCQYVKYSEPS